MKKSSKKLQELGNEVLLAVEGKGAIRMVLGNKARAIQLLITDVVMPGMSGRELR